MFKGNLFRLSDWSISIHIPRNVAQYPWDGIYMTITVRCLMGFLCPTCYDEGLGGTIWSWTLKFVILCRPNSYTCCTLHCVTATGHLQKECRVYRNVKPMLRFSIVFFNLFGDLQKEMQGLLPNSFCGPDMNHTTTAVPCVERDSLTSASIPQSSSQLEFPTIVQVCQAFLHFVKKYGLIGVHAGPSPTMIITINQTVGKYGKMCSL